MLQIDTKKTLNCNGNLLTISKPLIMGIINVTPDSFFKGSRFVNEPKIIERVQQITSQGGDIIDIGACSSRPDAKYISEQEELDRLSFALNIINKNFENLIISVDTFRANIAKTVVENHNVSIINDISAGEHDSKMFETIAKLNVPYIMMHMKGTPIDMQKNPVYNDVVKEITLFFSKKLKKLRLLGVKDVIIDPGFGFGKTIEHNYEILKRLNEFEIFDLPLLVGISRKSMIYKLLNIEPKDALNGTTILNTVALQKGANILRVHDVKEAKQLITILKTINYDKTI